MTREIETQDVKTVTLVLDVSDRELDLLPEALDRAEEMLLKQTVYVVHQARRKGLTWPEVHREQFEGRGWRVYVTVDTVPR